MSSATLTFIDTDEGTVSIKIEFDPPMKREGNIEIASHLMAAQFAEFLSTQLEEIAQDNEEVT